MAGIYIHIPFCKQKCSYCDFHFSTRFSEYRAQMIDAMVNELIDRTTYLNSQLIETVYFGGGTPSILLHEELAQLLEAVQKNYAIASDVEITLEANPDDITHENLRFWKSVGVNRLSIGIQSFRAKDLEWMNRAHNVQEAEQCIALAKSEGFENLTIDLMYGLPDLSLDEWKAHIQTIIDLNVPHISAYCLTVEEKTALDHWVKEGKIVPATDDQQSDQFIALLEMVEANGYEQYEISNFSKGGFESRHNSNYWKGVDYLGIGPSAHSFNGTERRWNIANNHQYMKLVEVGEPHFDIEKLTTANQFNEMLLIGLRTKYGVRLDRLRQLEQLSDEFQLQIAGFIQKGWMEQHDNTIRLTKEGKLRADFIAAELFMEA